MVLNYIWIFFFAVAFIVALFRLVIGGDTEVFSAMMTSTFDMSKTGFEISLGLTGVLTLWMGIMKVGERGGAVQVMSGMINPFFRRLFPGLPQDSPAHGSIMMNLAANMLGLDNAATPMGLKAMQQMQEVNTRKDAASNAQIMFLVLNTSGLTIVPVSIMVYRAQLGAANPTDILAYLGGISALMAGVIWYFSTLDKEAVTVVSNVASNIILFGIIMVFIGMAAWKRINVYDAFIEGAKDGFATAVKIIPYLIAILVAIGVFRASGAMEVVMSAITRGIEGLGFNADWVDALPTALMKPLSGSGARGMMIDTMKTFGADSFAGRLACTFQGATDTTFYIIAVYFGAVGIRNTRYAVPCGLIADLAGIIAAVVIAYLFFA